ncbi:sensor histidine kinase [Algoriphagus halophytocola]|uniref:Histidine kinase n=1 Tax=Algoriphagus halophytocola TaxID=2991499 RepID=A0ABY6MLD6_9BACT|nr:histidine kinase [Algoriphagus sp. TR-M5]UZD24567.1 histidine kinase [Algoriphagus sp. TR-M5]
MFSKAFSNPAKGNWIIQGAGVIWFLATFGLLSYYGINQATALVDALVFALLFVFGVSIIERTFDFYVPTGRNNSMLLIFPLLYSFLALYLHFQLLKWIFDQDEMYAVFLRDVFLLRWAILGMAEVLVALLALAVSKLEEQKEAKNREVMMNELAKEAELSQLRQQLQPHFLFNSLNSINALVVSQPQKAREMVLQLSDFLRGTIRKDHQKWIALEEELTYLRMYLDIERVRFGHRLQVDFSIEEDAKMLKVPQLLIQPLLENAIKHGLYGITEDVKIRLEAVKNQNYLLVKIENPFDPDANTPQGAGFGLSSVERRLFLLFGRKDLLLSEREGSLFTVVLKIPQPK